jgi:hypothetical protein
MNVKDIRANVKFTLMYGEFSIHIENTHNRTLYFRVSEKNGNKGWIDVPQTAANYILKDFKKTEEYQKIEELFKPLLIEYGF